MSFRIGNGTRQGGVISPYLFARYIRELLGSVRNTGTGCFVGNVCMNILAYADDNCCSCAILACFADVIECATLTVHSY